jgi:hypothetical protein
VLQPQRWQKRWSRYPDTDQEQQQDAWSDQAVNGKERRRSFRHLFLLTSRWHRRRTQLGAQPASRQPMDGDDGQMMLQQHEPVIPQSNSLPSTNVVSPNTPVASAALMGGKTGAGALVARSG